MTGEMHDGAPSQGHQDEGELSPNKLLALAADPRFPEAARHLAAGLSGLFERIGPPPAELIDAAQQAPVEVPPAVES